MQRELRPTLLLLPLLLVACATPSVTRTRVYLQQADYDRAIWHGRRAIEQHAHASEMHYLVGVAYAAKDRRLDRDSSTYADSAMMFVRASQKHLAQATQYSSARDDAVNEVTQAIFTRHFKLAIIAAKHRTFESAVLEYRLATLAKPQDHRGFYGLASATWELARAADARGDRIAFETLTQSAAEDLERVLATAPPDSALRSAVHQARGDLAYKRDEREVARREYETAATLDPTNHSLLQTMGERAFNAQQWDAAVELFQKSLEIQEQLSQTEAIHDEGRLIQTFPTPESTTYQALGTALLQLERTEEAVAAYERAQELAPEDTLLRMRIRALKALVEN